MRARHGARLLHAEMRADRLLMVLHGDACLVAAERARLSAENPARIVPVEMIDGAGEIGSAHL